ncbi:efflux RND transporter permease subunit [Hymenobacter aquaticus]|uniref:Efflux RND transporter permease subunit n=1 Tax=Hymenobacter aquaticus TaxID=1867101 RepID=A0A4Z0Q0U0_9BACT|nr:efflux RND transporter permease subunit [Hymenobacter aquaticus]TGE23660.1 efflux RND transporter permease subunit [Hymenobacter aquaticus]
MNLVKSSLRYPQVTLAVLLMAFLAGIYSLLTMPRREDPKITIRVGLVVAYFPGATAEQVEAQVTQKLEEYLFRFSEVRKEKTYSTTRDGQVIINVELNENVARPDEFWSKLRHELNVAKAVDLPPGVRGPVVNTDFGDTVAMLIAVESDRLSYGDLRAALRRLEDQLRTVKGISKIKRYGEQPEQIYLTANSERLAQYGLKLPQVVQVLQSQNSISATGNVKVGSADVPLHTSGYFSSEQQIANQIIGSAPTGQVIRVGDVAAVTRRYAEPTALIRVDGRRALLLSVEMLEGNNIVDFGEAIQAKLAESRPLLPADLRVHTIVDQPELVDHSISHFIREFFLAIVAVVVVCMLLLPFSIASVAAMAIPVTVAVTFAVMNLMGIELHQVSLAALIVVLGMVVDDAIVIADNYVELLDEGMDRWEAAWRSASNLVIPVLTATLTIIASFLPMVLLTGSVGEFIRALPVTIAVALASSFVVAMLLTPILCYTFIKKGLHAVAPGTAPATAPDGEAPAPKKKKFSLLDLMQAGYDRLLTLCMRLPGLTIGVGVLSIVAGVLLYRTVKQRFFPAAERNQFAVEIWMPMGTRLETTDQAVRAVEQELRRDKRVTDVASFTGTSAPRFYYNFSPEPPASNYGQLLVNTHSEEETTELAAALSRRIDALVPNGRPQVKLMQQGSPTKAPVEVRLIGDDLPQLKQLGEQVQAIIRQSAGSYLVRTDFENDYYGLTVRLRPEANRLGFTTGSIAQTIGTGFAGAPVSTWYEGDTPLSVVLRLDSTQRAGFQNLANTYITSPATGARVPLRQVADLVPQWQTGRLMHRNGVRTLTVQSETTGDVLPSQLLKEIQPKIAALRLPPGYRVEYGGEVENQKTTFAQMMMALGVSMVLIFLILLFQFRNLKETLLVMASIPLSLFGAILGLVVTHNPFGFTAFLGLISLSGIVVRNSIILVDFANELIVKQGMSIPEAAMEAGKRRLRPIFLTTMAAAIGVLPMILSGSPMWSPLASVIAVGLIFSMFMALLVTPVLFSRVVKPQDKLVSVEGDGPLPTAPLPAHPATLHAS